MTSIVIHDPLSSEFSSLIDAVLFEKNYFGQESENHKICLTPFRKLICPQFSIICVRSIERKHLRVWEEGASLRNFRLENDLRLVFDKRIEKLRFYHFVTNHSFLLICGIFHLIIHLALPNEHKKVQSFAFEFHSNFGSCSDPCFQLQDSINWSITVHYVFLIFYCFTTLWLCCCKFLTHERPRLNRLICIITGLIVPSIFWLENYSSIRSGAMTLAYQLRLTDCSYILAVIYLIYQFFNFNLAWRMLFVMLISFLHYGYLTTILNFFDFKENVATVLIFLAFDIFLYVGTFYQNYDRERNLDDFEEAVNKKTIVEFEKERQDQLLLSIIPIYLADKVRKTILNRASKIRESIDYSGDQSKLFYDLHVQQHDNVSILFADIVKFTQLSVTLTPAELVRFLNELYTRFDTLAQSNHFMLVR
uniref:adenylate cyclase n=1 Tax=Romanomermis culicivorax TaxID=13658 RepID=A0A915K7C6_ROMCU